MDIKTTQNLKAFAYLNPFRWKIARYALVNSDTVADKAYDVVKKVSLWGTKYVCSCPDYFWRHHDCKHIKRFKEQEKAQAKA